MIISDELEFVYIHIPHTGGTSLWAFLQNRVLDVRKIGQKHAPGWTGPRPENGDLNPDYPDDYFVFTTARNHWDWVKSSYIHTVRFEGGPVPDRYDYIQSKNADVNDFAVDVILNNERHTNDYLRVGQFNWMGENAEDVDYYMVMDGGTIVGFEHVKDKLGLEGELPHVMNNTSKKRNDVFSQRGVAAVREHFNDEIDFFGYQF